MDRVGLYLLPLLTVVLCDPVQKPVRHVANEDFLKRQTESMLLFFHVDEPNHVERCKNISATWSLEDNVQHFKDETAVRRWVNMWENKWLLPRHVPFSLVDYTYEVNTLFNVLHSAKDYETFYKAAVYVRERVNEDLFIYVLTAAVIHRSDMQGFFIPPIYEMLSQYYNNAEVVNIAQKINVYGESVMKDYPIVYKWENNFVIKWNYTTWPYYSKSAPMSYFTQDQALSMFYYYFNLGYPNWLGGDVVPLIKDARGEWFWFIHKQIVSRYYMERLSNGLGEIEDLGYDVVEEGYNSGLVYPNGIPFPVRANHFQLNQPEFVDKLTKIQDYERRIRDAIDSGYYLNVHGEYFNIRHPDLMDLVGRLIDANVDSPNLSYYKDFISLWKSLLGNSGTHAQSHEGPISLVVPSVLEHYQTALRDPAFFMIWKRVLNLFSSWQQTLQPYTKEKLECSSVTIEKVELDKLLTYFDYSYMNITAILPMNKEERKLNYDQVSVAVQYPRLNHKEFNVRIHVKSEVAKKVVVWFYMAPRYDGRGREIPLHENWKNVFLWDQFVYDLPEGDCVITRKSTNNGNAEKEWKRADEVYQSAKKAIEGNGEYYFDDLPHISLFPRHLVLPKGRVDGMPYQFIVYISDYRPPRVPLASNFDPVLSSGYGSGARQLTGDPLGFPFNRPLTSWHNLRNIYDQYIMIYHKPSPEIVVPYFNV